MNKLQTEHSNSAPQKRPGILPGRERGEDARNQDLEVLPSEMRFQLQIHNCRGTNMLEIRMAAMGPGRKEDNSLFTLDKLLINRRGLSEVEQNAG